MSALLAPRRAGPVATALLAAAAVAVLVAGFEHARLFHRGYSEVEVVGPLFLLNAIGSAGVVLLLLAGLPTLFVAGGLAIEVGSLVSILVSHTTSFFGFAESALFGAATVIVVAEVAAVFLLVAGGLALALDRQPARKAVAA